MGYFYNTTPQEIAGFGQGLGQSLGQAFIGLPQQRAEMAIRLAELQRQNQQMQQMGQYRQSLLGLQQQREQDMSQYRQDESTRKTNYDQGMLQFHNSQLQNQETLNQMRLLMAQLAQQKMLQPHIQDGQLIQGQTFPQPMPAGVYGPSRQELGADAPTGVQWNVSPVAGKNNNPASLYTALANMQRNYMGGIGSTNQAMSDFSRTNIFPALMQLQQRAMGQPTQQGLTNGIPQPATQMNTNDPLGLF